MSCLITREEVKKHSNDRSVWMVIHNEVYDVTKFLDEHPGGPDSLMDFAGQDGTQGFEDVGHSDDAREMMKQYKIGNLPPEEQTQSPTDSCCKKKKSSANASRKNDCIVCHQASRPKAPKTEYKGPTAPRAGPRVQTVVVPRERRPRGAPCESPRPSNLKWALLALGAAIVIGVVMKKYMT